MDFAVIGLCNKKESLSDQCSTSLVKERLRKIKVSHPWFEKIRSNAQHKRYKNLAKMKS